MEGHLVRLCIDAASESRESIEIWRRQRRTLERMPAQLADALLRQLLGRRLVYPSLLEVFQQCVEEIDLKGESFVDAEWMAYLGSFRHLRALNLADCRGINNAAIWSITGMTTLKELDLSRCSKVTDAGIEHLLSIPSLKKLCIPESGLTAKGIMRLSTLSKLSFLDLGGLPVTDLALHSLQALTQMEYLDLWGSKISNKGAEILKIFPKLNFLNLAWTNVTKLSKLPSLTCLNLSNCTIQYIFEGEDGVRTPLSKLVISGATFTDVHEAFSYMEASSLSFLDISNSTVQDFRFLEDMNRLEYLDVSSSRMEDDLLKSVACVGWNLKDLNLSNTKISTLGVATLAGKVPNLQTLCLSHTAVDDAVLSYISMMPSLRAINLRNTNIKGFTNQGGHYEGRVLSLTALQNLDHLEWLDLEDTQIRDEVLHPLSAFRELNHLSLKSDFLSDISLHTVSSLPKLKSLGIRGAVLSNNGLLSLQPPSMLQMLDLRECWLLTEDAISTFCRNHPRIVVQHELVHTSSICQNGGDGSSPSRGTSSAAQARLKKGKSSQVSCRFRRQNFVGHLHHRSDPDIISCKEQINYGRIGSSFSAVITYIYKFLMDTEKKSHVPKYVKTEDWLRFVDISSTETALAASQVGKTARSKMKSPHTTGTEGCVTVAAELKAQRPNEPVTRTDVFWATHKRKDGSSSSPEVDAIITARESDRSVVESDIDNDAVAKVFGRDGKGCVLGLGMGVSKTARQHLAPYKRASEEET